MPAPYCLHTRSRASARHARCVLVWLGPRAHPGVRAKARPTDERDRPMAPDAARAAAHAAPARPALLAAELALDRPAHAGLRVDRRRRALPDRRLDRPVHGLPRARVPAPEPARAAPIAEHDA